MHHQTFMVRDIAIESVLLKIWRKNLNWVGPSPFSGFEGESSLAGGGERREKGFSSCNFSRSRRSSKSFHTAKLERHKLLLAWTANNHEKIMQICGRIQKSLKWRRKKEGQALRLHLDNTKGYLLSSDDVTKIIENTTACKAKCMSSSGLRRRREKWEEKVL